MIVASGVITATLLAAPPLSMPADYPQDWVLMASEMIAAATPDGCMDCIVLAACTLVNDAVVFGFDPWMMVLDPTPRWGSVREPARGLEEAALMAAILRPDLVCAKIPPCTLFGNTAQLLGWRAAGVRTDGVIVAGFAGDPEGDRWGTACIPISAAKIGGGDGYGGTVVAGGEDGAAGGFGGTCGEATPGEVWLCGDGVPSAQFRGQPTAKSDKRRPDR